MLTRLIEALVFGPRWLVIALLVLLSAPGWLAISPLFGWWVALALAYLYLLLVAAVASIGGVNAALLWLERRRRG